MSLPALSLPVPALKTTSTANPQGAVRAAALPATPSGPRVALAHDWLNQRGGAENVLEDLVEIFPGAPIYTSLYAPELMPAAYREWDVRTSFMQHLPGVAHHHQAYLPLYPAAFTALDLSGYDLVLSNKSGFCHAVRTGGARHVCYCLTPTRYLWLYDQYREREQIDSATSLALQPLLAALRQWDYHAAQQVDDFIAISRTVQERIRSNSHSSSRVAAWAAGAANSARPARTVRLCNIIRQALCQQR
ncbi:MAG: glycosyltransferase [Caldilineaceae bacterium]